MRMRTLISALLASSLWCTVAVAKKPAKAEPPLPQTMAKVTESKVAVDEQDEARKLAELYLKALTGQGSEADRDKLLGGATMTARIFTLENWKVVGRDAHRHEEGALEDVGVLVDALDKEGRAALAKIMGGGPGSEEGNDMATHEYSAEEAKQLLAPTRAKAALLSKTHPVFSDVARVDKEVYWHPKNPFRKLLADAGGKGGYALDYDRFWIETSEGLGEKTARKWPLRVVRFKSDKVDTGFRILPAADWNAE
jgi:hypothetical protein